MKAFLISLLIAVLLGIMFSAPLAQQNQNTQKSDPEIEALKKRISELESKLQTVENVEKMEIAAKLADAQAKLADANTRLLNSRFDGFEGKLRSSNNEWLRNWSLWFVGIISFLFLILSGAFWFWIKSLIADRVEKSLDGFKEAVAQQDLIKNQLRVLEKEHVVTVLENFMRFSYDESYYREQLTALPNESLLDVFTDKTRYLVLRWKAAEVLADKKSPRLVSPLLEFLNSAVDSEQYKEVNYETRNYLHDLVSFVGHIHTPESYEGLKKFLNRLLTENPEHKDLFLTWTVYMLAHVGNELNRGDSVSILREAIPHLEVKSDGDQVLGLIEHFDKFDTPESIQEILTRDLTDMMPKVETRCLELLQEKTPEFVEEWNIRREEKRKERREAALAVRERNPSEPTSF